MRKRMCLMATKITERERVLLRVKEKKLTQVQAAKDLKLSLRQTKRLYKAYKKHGNQALLSKKIGMKSNHMLRPELKEKVLLLIAKEEFDGCFPIYVCQRLYDRYKVKLSRETIRKLMIEIGTWQANKKKRPVVHQQRERRARFGELVQIDGSPHKWFEDRGERCCLISFVDDSTGQVFGKFFESETTDAYMQVMQAYIKKHGIPQALYSDKHSIFRVNKPGCVRKENLTEFGRAMEELGISLICANSPQAKGRVENKFGTLQRWLVADFRHLKINSIEEANKHLGMLLNEHNKRYAIAPKNPIDAHKEPDPNVDMDLIFCEKTTRKVTKNLEISYKNKILQIDPHQVSAGLYKATVIVIEQRSGKILIEYKKRKLDFRILQRQHANGVTVTAKELNYVIDHINDPDEIEERRTFKAEHFIKKGNYRVAS